MHQLTAEPHNVVELLRTPGIFDLDDWVIEDRAGPRYFRGRLIGAGSSQREVHNHETTPNATRQIIHAQRCTACRWSELFIFEVLTSAGHGPFSAFKYAVYTLGASIVPGETTRANVRWATSGFEVVELATVRRGERGHPFLPAAFSRALAMAADVDENIAEAYINRAVA